MKTLKELLLERHRSAEPKLDVARGEFLAWLGGLRSPVRPERRGFEWVWRECLLPVRWHLAGMGAVWLVILLLNADTSPGQAAHVATANPPPPQQLLTALRQYHREILELTQPPPVAPIPLPPRRSQVLPSTAIA
jgi:hypothetical protein